MSRSVATIATVALMLLVRTVLWGDEPTPPPGNAVVATLMRLPNKTLGGDQFWADEFVQQGWRIQRNAFSDRYRLLDPDDYRRAHGSFDACRESLTKLQKDSPTSPVSNKAVILLHGLLRSRDCMVPLADYLAEQGNYETVLVSYPSTRAEVNEHAASLDKVINGLEGMEEVNFVAHSLGNVVVRHWLHDYYRPETAKYKLNRFVMLGPPNNGAQFARTFQQNRLFGLIAGPSGKQLGEDWAALTEHLCTPPCDFGILAGTADYSNPLVKGSDDLIVGLEETKLPGAADFRAIPASHGAMRSSEVVGEMTLRFLQHGYFTSEDERARLPK